MTTEDWVPNGRDYLAAMRHDETVADALVDLIMTEEANDV